MRYSNFLKILLVSAFLSVPAIHATQKHGKDVKQPVDTVRELETQILELRVEMVDLKLQISELRETLLKLMDVKPAVPDSTTKETK